jgi:enoyl-CoA hydratase
MDEAPDAVLLVDEPLPRVRRLTLNRPHKRNALNDELRLALFEALRAADADEAVSVVVIRGAGGCFSAGYDLGERGRPVERAAATNDGWWARHVVTGWFELWDMATPLVAQVHGWCLAGGSELARRPAGHGRAQRPRVPPAFVQGVHAVVQGKGRAGQPFRA